MVQYGTFLSPEKRYAVFGVSLQNKNLGFNILRFMRESGYSVVGINPGASEENDICPGIKPIKELPDTAIISVAPGKAVRAVSECINAGIRDIWMQPGTINAGVKQALNDSLADIYTGRCLVLYLDSAGFPHNLHRGLLRLFGKL